MCRADDGLDVVEASLRRGRGGGGCLGGAGAAADDGDDGVDGDGGAFLDLDFGESAGDGRGDFGVDLVGGDFEDGLVAGDGVADFLEPLGDGAFGDGLAHLRHQDFGAGAGGSGAGARGCCGSGYVAARLSSTAAGVTDVCFRRGRGGGGRAVRSRLR